MSAEAKTEVKGRVRANDKGGAATKAKKDGTMKREGSLKAGYLIKEGGKNKVFQLRYIVIKPLGNYGELTYYDSEESPKVKGLLSLEGATVLYEGQARDQKTGEKAKKVRSGFMKQSATTDAAGSKRRFFNFVLTVQGENEQKKGKDNHGGAYRFIADDQELAESWVRNLVRAGAKQVKG
jgi:hypothetical protein